jgi:hypothetical protein
VEEKTGDVVPVSVLAQRVGWAADLVSGMAVALLAGHWDAADVDVLAGGVDATGRALPSNAWMALRRLGWTVTPWRQGQRPHRAHGAGAGRTHAALGEVAGRSDRRCSQDVACGSEEAHRRGVGCRP